MWAEFILKDDQLKAIGCLAVESSMLDQLMGSLIPSLVGPAISDLLLGKNAMMGAKATILKAVFVDEVDMIENQKKDGLKQRVADLMDKITSDIANRNTVIHGEWAFDPKPLTIREWFDAHAKEAIATKASGNKVKATEVMMLAKRFDSYQDQLKDLYEEYLTMHMSSPSRHA